MGYTSFHIQYNMIKLPLSEAPKRTTWANPPNNPPELFPTLMDVITSPTPTRPTRPCGLGLGLGLRSRPTRADKADHGPIVPDQSKPMKTKPTEPRSRPIRRADSPHERQSRFHTLIHEPVHEPDRAPKTVRTITPHNPYFKLYSDPLSEATLGSPILFLKNTANF